MTSADTTTALKPTSELRALRARLNYLKERIKDIKSERERLVLERDEVKEKLRVIEEAHS